MKPEQSREPKRPATRRTRKRKVEPNVPMHFPCEFWERVLWLRDHRPATFALFSPGFKLSADVYEQQRDQRRLKAAA
jgi:hypothetical protein